MYCLWYNVRGMLKQNNITMYDKIYDWNGKVMINKELRASFLLLLTAAIWGFAFVAQRVGMQYIGAFTFNGIRFALGSLSLVPIIRYFEKKNKDKLQ